ncbi:LEA type 2 family protein [Geobacter argillaceus]|uniref:LEA14-like dessication related protein n=1 Tax=Geobacter argillaceus TaxID=345631 RepID=A0A562WQS9_9BACT|nr:LEA type 2 family protein [Geobacter argillaceus]TWJ32710.1 LEA14-like dessication related protein [Geobacter argillaceus]
MKRILALVFLVITGCTMFVAEPTVTVQRANIINLDTRGVDLEFLLAVQNPNSYGITLNGYHYDLQVVTLPVARGGARERVEFRGKGTTDFRLPVRIEYKDLLAIMKRRPDPDKIPYRLQADLDVETPVGQLLIPIDKVDAFTVPDHYRPSFYLKEIPEFVRQLLK